MNKLEIIALSHSNTTAKVSSAPEVIHVTDYGTLEGRNGIVLYIKAEEGTFATNSPAYIETFIQAVDALKEARMALVIQHQNNTSKNGRAYRLALPKV